MTYLYDAEGKSRICTASFEEAYKMKGLPTQIVFGVESPWFKNRGEPTSDAEADYHAYRKYLEKLFKVQVQPNGAWSVTCRNFNQFHYLAVLIRNPIEMHEDKLEMHYPRLWRIMKTQKLGALSAYLSIMPGVPEDQATPDRKTAAYDVWWKVCAEPAKYQPVKIDSAFGHGMWEVRFALTCDGLWPSALKKLRTKKVFDALAKCVRPIGASYLKGIRPGLEEVK